MRFINIICLIFTLNGLLTNNIAGQTTDIGNSRLADQNIIFPPLSVLIDSAIKHNAMVKFRELEIDLKNSNLKSFQNYWTRNFGFQADTRYGTFNNFSTNTSEGQSPSTLATASSQLNYGVGAYVKLPISDLVNHKNLVSQAKSELEMARSMADAQKDEVRQLIIKLYNDLLMKQKLLGIKSRNQADSKVNMEMVENEFRNGVIPVSEYVRISEFVSRSESDYESAKSDFITAFMIMEQLAGFNINLAKP